MKIEQKPTVTMSVTIELTEVEARALEAISSYGDSAIKQALYEGLGTHYIKNHQAGIDSLMEAVRMQIKPILRRTDKARAIFNEA